MNRSKDSPDIPVEDFMPKFELPDEIEEKEEVSSLEALAIALGAEIVRK
jgi:hypothetical protein